MMRHNDVANGMRNDYRCHARQRPACLSPRNPGETHAGRRHGPDGIRAPGMSERGSRKSGVAWPIGDAPERPVPRHRQAARNARSQP
ncbi:hypothetical protein [Novacetimonas pomaceti]|uniref:hypothetical protein n=1 Tax=Novacetimonas pomaceti TaxID=2021998 RepID=UPI001C2DA373|nr:hypothetical protein [Novacetimonas pomaceti]MBV1833227.1 hypothetical protein [Novacetimonas pomaceti]